MGRRPAKDVLTCNAPLLQQDIVLVPCDSENSQHWFLLALLPKQFQIGHFKVVCLVTWPRMQARLEVTLL